MGVRETIGSLPGSARSGRRSPPSAAPGAVELVGVGDLSPPHLAAWDEWQRTRPTLRSPFFRPEYSAIVARHLPAVRVVVVDHGDSPRALLPLQADAAGSARPVGAQLTDYQGIIGRDDDLDVVELLRRAGLRSYRFDHVPVDQVGFGEHATPKGESPYLDLAGGFEHYAADRRAAGSELVAQTANRRRRMERRVGPVRFELHSDDPHAFEALVRWKSAQYEATGVDDLFAHRWALGVVRDIWETGGGADTRFQGLLSCLWAGDELAAVHLGLRSGPEWHWWLPAYDATHAAYSPGIQLLLAMAEAAPALGVDRIDLGRGDEPYKARFRSQAVPMTAGLVEVPSARVVVRKVRSAARRLGGRR